MTLEPFLLLLLTFLLVGLLIVVYARWNFGVLERMGIPIVKDHHWFFGHNWEDLHRVKEYGSFYGVYEGRTPMVYISDPLAIQKILLSNWQKFNKRERDFGNPIINEAFEFLNGEKWKIVRNAMSPQFTSSKLRPQCQVMEKVCKDHMKALREKVDSTGLISRLDIHEFLAPLMIEIIAEAMCGIKIENPRDPNNIFVHNMRIALFDGFMPGKLHRYIEVFPFLAKLFPYVPLNVSKVLGDYVTRVLNTRERSGEKKSDIVNALLELRRRARTDPLCKQLGITDTTVFGATMEFFTASFQGTCSTLRQLFYHLVNHPEIYERIEEELTQTLMKHESMEGVMSYEAANDLMYMEACINETLRISPGFFWLDRTCIEDWTYEGIRFPKGTQISFPLFALHYNPDYFPEPHTFDPERFLGGRKASIPSCTFLRWGEGQRRCMGIRLGMLTMKIVTAHILMEYKLMKRMDTRWIEKPGNHFLLTLEPVYLDLVHKSTKSYSPQG